MSTRKLEGARTSSVCNTHSLLMHMDYYQAKPARCGPSSQLVCHSSKSCKDLQPTVRMVTMQVSHRKRSAEEAGNGPAAVLLKAS